MTKTERDYQSKKAWAYEHGFRIITTEPSSVVKVALEQELIPQGSRILDLGCGKNPRNTVFLANNYFCKVDAIDLEPPDFAQDIPPQVLERINHSIGSILEVDYDFEVYQVAILARLIQYISPRDLELLFSKVSDSLLPDGIVTLSYTSEGGILNKSREYKIKTFSHSIDKVKELLEEKRFVTLFKQLGTNQSTHVPHSGEYAITYDLIAQKRVNYL